VFCREIYDEAACACPTIWFSSLSPASLHSWLIYRQIIMALIKYVAWNTVWRTCCWLSDYQRNSRVLCNPKVIFTHTHTHTDTTHTCMCRVQGVWRVWCSTSESFSDNFQFGKVVQTCVELSAVTSYAYLLLQFWCFCAKNAWQLNKPCNAVASKV
jgi:hypothetical protein